MTKDEALKLTEIMNHAIWDSVQVVIQPDPTAHKCNPHPKAPHGFNRGASHAYDRYVCDCEGWDAYEAGRMDGMQSMLKWEEDNAPAPHVYLTAAEIVDCATAVYQCDPNDVSENDIKFARHIERLTLER